MADTSKWLPIETAPKDGTEVIVGVGVGSTWIARNSRCMYGTWLTPYVATHISSGHETILAREGKYKPTHWIPMPEPPE